MRDRVEWLENKLKSIEKYLDRHPEIPIEVVVNIKNIIYSDETNED